MRLLPRRTRRPERLLRNALKRVNAHPARTEGSGVDVQLLAQVSVSDDWPHIREYWTRRAGMTGSWPARVAPDELVLNLWPIPPGQLHLTTGVGVKPQRRQPRNLLGTPALTCFEPAQDRASADAALARAIAGWVDDVLAHGEYSAGLRLAPPILEEWASKGRLVRRRIVTFDLEWQLAGAEGLTWPASA